MNLPSEQLLKQKGPWLNDFNPIWVASNIALRRNVEKFKFPAKLAKDRRKQIIALLSQEMLSSKLLLKPYLLNGEEIGALEKDFLVEHFLSSEQFTQAHSGEAFIVDETGEFLASLNLKDHLHIQIIDIKGELESSWNKLVKIEENLNKTISFAYTPEFGFLTADPMEAGTGLHISTFLQLTALIQSGELAETLKKLEDDAIETTHFLGADIPVGDVLIVSNRFTLGVNEESIIQSVRSYTTKLMNAEITARKKAEKSDEMKDKVSRAYAILIHSYQIETQEALNAISLLKMGAELNWVSGVSVAQLNELFFNIRRSHLLRLFPEKIAPEQIAHKRAEYFHSQLKAAKLLI